MYFSKNCVYSRAMLETLVRHKVRGVMACVCVETQASLVPHFVNCTPAVYIPAERKLLKNSAVKAYVDGLVSSTATAMRSNTTATRSNTTSAAATTAGDTSAPGISTASDPDTPSDPDAVNAVEHRATYTWIGDDAEGRRNDLRSGTLPFVSFGPDQSSATTTSTASSVTPPPPSAAATTAPTLSKREILMNARLKQMQAQREAEVTRRV